MACPCGCAAWEPHRIVVPVCRLMHSPAPPRFCHCYYCRGPCEARFALKCNGGAYRRALFKLERGVCVLCKLDCDDLVRRLQAVERGTHKCGGAGRGAGC